MYLSSLVRAVIALHALVDNKATNLELEEGRAEDEGGKKTKSTSQKPPENTTPTEKPKNQAPPENKK